MSRPAAGVTPDPTPDPVVNAFLVAQASGLWGTQVENLCHQIKEMVGSAHPTRKSRTPPDLIYSSKPAP